MFCFMGKKKNNFDRISFFEYAKKIFPMRFSAIDLRMNHHGICEYCFNTGFVETISCNKSASNCCGGCFVESPCCCGK